MNPLEHALLCARIEFNRTRVLSTTTVMKLAGLGVDVPALEHSFEEELTA